MSYLMYLIIIGIILLGAGGYFLFSNNSNKKIIAFYVSNTVNLVLPELIKTNLTVTSTPALGGATVTNIIGTPFIGIQASQLSPNTSYTFSISGYETSNPIYIRAEPSTPDPAFTITKTDTSVTITHPIVANTISYNFLISVLYSNNPNNLPNPFTYKTSSQTTNICTFSDITPSIYLCYAQATNATSITLPASKVISIPLIINNPIIAVRDTTFNDRVYLYFNKNLDNQYQSSSITAIPSANNLAIFDPNLSNGLTISQLTTNTLYQFSITGITGTSNSIFMGQGNLASANVTPVITKVSANSFTASIPAVTGASSYQFIVYNNNYFGMGIGYLYSAVTQATSTMTYSNVPNGTYNVTIQASSSIGSKVGISSNIVIPQP